MMVTVKNFQYLQQEKIDAWHKKKSFRAYYCTYSGTMLETLKE